MSDVHCPKCGEQMSLDGEGHLICPKAGDWLSPRMNELLPRLAAEAPSDSPESKPVRWGPGWHCVADGRQMEPGEGSARCPQCGRQLAGSVLYELTEFNVHTRWVRTAPLRHPPPPVQRSLAKAPEIISQRE